jgi:hypothetical protein
VDARARKARDKFVLLEILFRVRGRIVDNPALNTQARLQATEENRGHPISSARAQALIDLDQAARLQALPSYNLAVNLRF